MLKLKGRGQQEKDMLPNILTSKVFFSVYSTAKVPHLVWYWVHTHEYFNSAQEYTSEVHLTVL